MDTLPKALLVAAVCLVLFLLFNYVLVATARLHAVIARSLLQSTAACSRHLSRTPVN